MKTRALIPVAIALAVFTAAVAAQTRPNIVFIHADDLGYGDLSCYGQRKFKTPNIDRLAAEGMRFTQYYAGSTVCAPSRSALMTGQHTGHTRIRGNARHPLLPEDVTVAEVLKSAGYKTALIGKWGLGEAGTTGVPNRQGFDYFFGYLNQRHAHNYYPTFLWRNEEQIKLRNVVPDEDKEGAGIRVPMIARWPKRIKPGRAGAKSEQVWAHWDLLPTVAEIAGVKPPPNVDGVSMLNALLGRKQRNHEFLYWEFHERGFSQAVRMGDWKAVRKSPDSPLELYDLKNDLGELNDVAVKHPEVVKKIEDYLKTARTESELWPTMNR